MIHIIASSDVAYWAEYGPVWLLVFALMSAGAAVGRWLIKSQMEIRQEHADERAALDEAHRADRREWIVELRKLTTVIERLAERVERIDREK